MPETPNINRSRRFRIVNGELNDINQVPRDHRLSDLLLNTLLNSTNILYRPDMFDRVQPPFEYLSPVAPLTPQLIAVQNERIRINEPRILIQLTLTNHYYYLNDDLLEECLSNLFRQ